LNVSAALLQHDAAQTDADSRAADCFGHGTTQTVGDE
jgi:hypothetical protein